MKHTEPLPIHHSWPIYERERHFALGQLLPDDVLDASSAMADHARRALPSLPAPGTWAYDFDNASLSWSPEVYALFGLPDGARISRDETAALYCADSRVAMERLRAYAIRHRRGFTLDAQIQPARGRRRWIRLIAAPVCVDDRVVRLDGLKLRVPTRQR